MKQFFSRLKGIVFRTNPTPGADGAERDIVVDPIGRQVVYPYVVRDLVATGYLQLTRAQEGSVIAAVAATYLDLVEVSVSNTSTVAQKVDIRSATGGGIEDTIEVPIGSSVTRHYPLPIPDAEKATPWTAQNSSGGEISDSPVYVSMRAIKNV